MGGALRAAGLAAEFGFAVVSSLVGGVLLGRYLDQRWHTAPVLFLVGLVAGLVFSFYLIYVLYRLQLQPNRPVRRGLTEPADRASGPSGPI